MLVQGLQRTRRVCLAQSKARETAMTEQQEKHEHENSWNSEFRLRIKGSTARLPVKKIGKSDVSHGVRHQQRISFSMQIF